MTPRKILNDSSETPSNILEPSVDCGEFSRCRRQSFVSDQSQKKGLAFPTIDGGGKASLEFLTRPITLELRRVLDGSQATR